MHAGVTGQIRKTAIGRWLLFHANTGLFWIYGILSFWLAFLLIEFWVHGTGLRLLMSFVIGLVGAFMLPWLVHVLFWNRFHCVWLDNYVIVIFFLAIVASGYVHDMRNGRDDALWRLVTRVAVFVIASLISYLDRNRQARRDGISADLDRGGSREV